MSKETEKTIYDNIIIKGKDYFTYLQKTERMGNMRTALNKFTQLRKDMEKGRKEKITLSEFANYVCLSPEVVRNILKL